MTTSLVLLLVIASAAPSPSDTWAARAKSALKRGNVMLRSEDAAGAKAAMCEAVFYYSQALEVAPTDELVRGAFNASYAADLLQTAAAIYPRIAAPTENEKLLKADIDQQATHADQPCPPHVAVCGDALVEGTEACDDGNVAEGDGCNAMCAVEAAPPPVAAERSSIVADPPPAVAEPPPTVEPASADASASSSLSALAIGSAVVGGLGLVTSGIAIVAGVYENGEMNAQTAPLVFKLAADERKGAEDARNAAYLVSAIAGVVGVAGAGMAVLSWE